MASDYWRAGAYHGTGICTQWNHYNLQGTLDASLLLLDYYAHTQVQMIAVVVVVVVAVLLCRVVLVGPIHPAQPTNLAVTNNTH